MLWVTFQMWMECFWLKHNRYIDPQPAMYPRFSHWFPEALAPQCPLHQLEHLLILFLDLLLQSYELHLPLVTFPLSDDRSLATLFKTFIHS